MPEHEIRYRPIVDSDLNQAGGGSGGSGGGSSGGGGSGGSSGGSASNESRENPSYTGRGDSRNNNTHSQPYPQGHGEGMEQPNTSTGSQRTGSVQPNQSNGSQSQKDPPMTFCPPPYGTVSPYGINPYLTGYGYGVPPVAPAGANVVVAGDHGHGTHSQLETLSDIALGGLRESAATGRTNQLSTQVAQLGDRMSMESGFSRELSTQKQFTDLTSRTGDVENRLLNAIKDENIRTREMFTEQRIRDLEASRANLQETVRDTRMLDVLQDIRRELRERATA